MRPEKKTIKYRDLLKALDKADEGGKIGDRKKKESGLFLFHLDQIKSLEKPSDIAKGHHRK
jgi:hypothetical protein